MNHVPNLWTAYAQPMNLFLNTWVVCWPFNWCACLHRLRFFCLRHSDNRDVVCGHVQAVSVLEGITLAELSKMQTYLFSNSVMKRLFFRSAIPHVQHRYVRHPPFAHLLQTGCVRQPGHNRSRPL